LYHLILVSYTPFSSILPAWKGFSFSSLYFLLLKLLKIFIDISLINRGLPVVMCEQHIRQILLQL
jgi:hypothetical protein